MGFKGIVQHFWLEDALGFLLRATLRSNSVFPTLNKKEVKHVTLVCSKSKKIPRLFHEQNLSNTYLGTIKLY